MGDHIRVIDTDCFHENIKHAKITLLSPLNCKESSNF